MSKRLIDVSLAAQADLAGRYEWLSRQAGIQVAEEMLADMDAAFHKLAKATGLGSLVETDQPELAGLRKWRTSRLSRLRIFYRATDDRLFVIRVLHVAQDRPAAFDGG